MELHQRGYLDMELRGKTNVFTCGQRLGDLTAKSTIGHPAMSSAPSQPINRHDGEDGTSLG
jgi:hypothetical protein